MGSGSVDQGGSLGADEGGSLGAAPGSSAPATNDGLYTGSVEVVEGAAADPSVLTGRVFDDANRNSVHDEGEVGVPDVRVSNGRDVVITDEQGRYELPATDNFTAFVTQPAGWQVPVDEQKVAQFSYNHLPEGSPELRFGGLKPTGDLPAAVNFPLAKSAATADPRQSCPIASDTQTYDMEEVGYASRGVPADLAARDDYAGCGILLLGDNVGDDLSLNQPVKDLYADANGPVRAIPGNHDMDFDAADATHSVDTYRRDFGAPYYSYEVGDTHFVGLFNIVYNGQKADGSNGGYAEALTQEQLDWLRNDLQHVERQKNIVVAAHAPIVDYRGVTTDNASALYEILADYPNAVTVGGHTHTLEHLLAGDSRQEWIDAGIPELTHDQLVAGAVSGSWYSGELNENGVPYSYTSDAAEPGVLTIEFDGHERSEYYTVRNESADRQFLTGINSPAWREWAEVYQQWKDDGEQGEAPAPVATDSVSTADVSTGAAWLAASFFGGSTDASVRVSVDGGEPVAAEHTQPATGEALNVGWEYTETVSGTHNLIADAALGRSSSHLWRIALPSDLEPGEHTAQVSATDRYGRKHRTSFAFTVTG
ncbi:metallophosphoesterase [Dietzia sp. E1]|nr:metallophosphoesterase [Dietzia sp. E1]